INMAQRVMDCGDAGHILLSKRSADDLAHYRQWQPLLHELGECEVKHGVKVSVVNLYGNELGNPDPPQKFQTRRGRVRAKALSGAAQGSGGRWIAIAAAALVCLTVAIAFWRLNRKDTKTPEQSSAAAVIPSVPGKSIAVLPFQNLSDDKANAYFADGVQEEILTTLAKIAGLKVISRTSVMQFRDTEKRNLRDIAQQLGVAHVLEGSVQRAANRVRVTAQLINARTDSHVWADRYDGDLADVFAIQSEVAQKIAGELRLALSPEERAAVHSQPTTDTTAYDLYLRAKELRRNEFPGMLRDREALDEQTPLLREAIARDPGFVSALCMLAEVHLRAYWYNFDHTPARLELARKCIDTAAGLKPDAGEVHRARARFHYWGYRDYDRALAELALARRSLPNDADLFFLSASIERRQGRWAESNRSFEQAARLDPRNLLLLQEYSSNHTALRNYDEARRVLDSVIRLQPDRLDFRVARADVELDATGDVSPLADVASRIDVTEGDVNSLAQVRMRVALLQRDYQAAERALAEYRLPDFVRAGFITPREYYEGIIARRLGDMPRANAAFLRARDRAAEAARARPDDAKALIVLGAIDAGLGRKEDAVVESERAIDMLPVAKDAFDATSMLARLARIYAELGETTRAIDALERAVLLPGWLHYGDLQLDDSFDRLRGEERFQRLVAMLAAKAAPSAR
ncbi:MAG: hypothetical protein ABR589_03640, partial [Chthoniobacterales bacterium]